MNEFAKPTHSFTSFDPFPYTNADLMGCAPFEKSFAMRKPNEDATDLCKDDTLNDTASNKKPLTRDERRAEHNAIERARRECLNTKFQSLAQALPNLINYRRPSKGQIVEKALDWIKQSIVREERYRYQILQLQRENKELMAQCMSVQQQISPTLPLNASPISQENGLCSGWSTSNHLHQMPSFASNEGSIRQDLGFKTDDDDSTNEDEIEYHPSFFKRNSLYSEQSQFQPVFMDHPLYALGFEDSNPTASLDPRCFYNKEQSTFPGQTTSSSYPLFSQVLA
ncbi:hypothetical protein G6F64_005391 [Rhizopus arrhizus]|uniref:BHLH domain-containing protein n=1 Tax=Rhizopus oryzae TaxID=64495 RepID=A0A9P7BSJ4_RHIOR|nr:hypothetical protein G6F64_005391 [Rhizopus arrhizus]